MEGNLIDSSKYKLSLLSLDSRYASNRAYSNGEFKIQLPHNMKNIMRIRMASAEIPFSKYEFSLAQGNTTFAVKVGASTTFTKCTPIPDGNYNTSRLVGAIQTSLQNVHSGFLVTSDPVTGLVTIQNTAVTFSIYLASYDQEIAQRSADWGIGYNLGFKKAILVAESTGSGNYFLKGDRILTLQTTQYFLLQLECPDSVENVLHPTKDKGYIGAFAKVILRDNAFSYNFDDNSNLMRKEFTWLAPANIPFFTCRLLDAWGKVVDMNDTEWSLTIEVTEVMNSRTYGDISRTYAR